MEPIRERILEAIVGRVQTITRGNGYRQDVHRVSRKHEFLETQSELPVVLVLPNAAETLKTYKLQAPIEGQMGVEIVCMVEGDDVVSPSTVLERLIADVEIALGRTETTPGVFIDDITLGLGGIVRVIENTGQFTELYVDSNEQARVYAGLLYRVFYDYLQGAP